jgi:hypothetical protein
MRFSCSPAFGQFEPACIEGVQLLSTTRRHILDPSSRRILFRIIGWRMSNFGGGMSADMNLPA